jgi:lipopolysaccharide transport system ATP-binding protein
MDRVSKFYPRVHRPGERLRAFAALLAGREPREGAEVLHDVSLEITPGQSFGIIGENGAGKSTLLKILTGVISPSSGSVEVNGQVAALLELGAGFQPEFSGIENIKMKAALLGMSRQQLDRKMDDILAFADIGDYVYEPVKHYSSGMVVRLGFAVVAASDPELLITDEVLAVGDESFQKKCTRWIESFLERGNTLLMVSHSMYIVQKLCQRALWLHEGRIRKMGEVFPVTQAYLGWHEEKNAKEKQQRQALTGTSGMYRVASMSLPEQLAGDDGEPQIERGGSLDIEMVLHSPDGRVPAAAFGLMKADGTGVYGVTSDYDGVQPVQLDEHHYRYRLRFDELHLLAGRYIVCGHALDPEAMRLCDTAELGFSVSGKSLEWGMVYLPHRWQQGDGQDDG